MIRKLQRAIKILREEGVSQFIRNSLNYLKEHACFALLPICLFKIKSLKKTNNLDKLVDFVFTQCFGLIKPVQVRNEILKFLTTLNKVKPKFVLEIGTANGGTLFLFTRIASENAIIISVDLPWGTYPGWKTFLFKSLGLSNQQINLIRADSHKEETLEKIKNILNGKKIDFLFIDGDHTYKGVKKDFGMYSSLVKEDGIIALHDIVPGPEEMVGGVPEFWNEIKHNYDHTEIVVVPKQEGYGIGLIKYENSINNI